MKDEAVAAAHERMAEQLMSDERILGAVPDDAAGVLLDWALARLDAAAAAAADVAAFAAAADAIRMEARSEADAAADRGDDAPALAAHLNALAAATSQSPKPLPAETPSRRTSPSDHTAEAYLPGACVTERRPSQPTPQPGPEPDGFWGRLRRLFQPHRGDA